jgi:hypothetical protein
MSKKKKTDDHDDEKKEKKKQYESKRERKIQENWADEDKYESKDYKMISTLVF